MNFVFIEFGRMTQRKFWYGLWCHSTLFIWLKQLPVMSQDKVEGRIAAEPSIPWLICQHRWAATVRSAAAVWSCSRIVSGVDNLIQLAVHERQIASDTRRFTSRVVHRRPASRRGLSRHRSAGRIAETHTRPSWEPIHYMLLFPYGATAFT